MGKTLETAHRLIYEYGRSLPELKNYFYNCIFDEVTEHYDISKPHKHLVKKAWFIKMPGYIYNGICYQKAENGDIIFGCLKKNFSKTK